MQQPATIKLFLVHGDPSGLRIAELSNWSGKAVAAPRANLSELLKRDEVASPGVYFLTGVDPDSGDRTIYIGEAESVAVRLRKHAGKDFWNSVTLFVSKDENLTKAHIRYLEGKLIALAEEARVAAVMNSASSGARLPEADAAEMDIFLEKCLQLLPVLGVSDFRRPTRERESNEGVLFCKIKGLVARGRPSAGGFVVFEGSEAVLQHRPSAKSIKTKREQLVQKGILQEKDGALVFTRDFEFGSPSTAGGVIRGGDTNGLTNWKDANGNSLRDLEQMETS